MLNLDPDRLRWIKQVKHPARKWAYWRGEEEAPPRRTPPASPTFDLQWRDGSRGNAAKPRPGDLALLTQHRRVTHLVRFLDDDVRDLAEGQGFDLARSVEAIWWADPPDAAPTLAEALGYPSWLQSGNIVVLENLGYLQGSDFAQLRREALARLLPRHPERWAAIQDPDAAIEDRVYLEGAVRRIVVNAYERDPAARRDCLAHYGTACFACGLDFGTRYGAHAAGFIHVHHVRPLHEVGSGYQVDPIRDLRPLCPNCHAAVHLTEPMGSPEDLRDMLRGRTS